MPDAPASETAMQFAHYVLENYIAVDSKFPPIFWAKPPDLLFPYTNNGAESYHRHLNAEFYVKHPNIYVFVDVLKKIQQLECGPMPNLMVALPNIGGALCSTPQSLADAHY